MPWSMCVVVLCSAALCVVWYDMVYWADVVCGVWWYLVCVMVWCGVVEEEWVRMMVVLMLCSRF